MHNGHTNQHLGDDLAAKDHVLASVYFVQEPIDGQHPRAPQPE
jgi:hypothetical protein